MEKFIIKCSLGYVCIKLSNGDVVLVQNVLSDTDDAVMTVYKKLRRTVPYFTYPLDSAKIGIYKLSSMQNYSNICHVSNIVQKYCMYP